jgi:hypothetical protein
VESACGCRWTLADVTRAHILEVLCDTNWAIGRLHGTAARLGLRRTTSPSRLEKLALPHQPS